ncbi:MAG: GFA family protein [Pseudomonadota bacterium]
MSFSGGCQCGTVRYTIASEALTAYACHCRECQKQSASGFGISVPVLEADLTIEGETLVWGRPTDSGSYTECHFCPKCGTRLYHSGRNRPGLVTIKGGSLDTIAQQDLVAHIWVKRKMKWLELPEDVPQWQAQPQTLDEWMELLGWDA